MMDRGVYLPCSQFEAAFLSAAHTEEHVQQTLSAAQFGALSEYGAEIAGPLTKGRVAGGPQAVPAARLRRSGTAQAMPTPAITERHVDYFGNAVPFLTMEGAHKKLVVKSEKRRLF